ncbi:MAG: glycosyltransferase family 2 protein, partial [Acidimicrobiales bacterium]
MKVSVCVPAFERPESTRLLIESFLAQDHADRELVIADDSRSDVVQRIVTGYADDRIVYRHHQEPWGFCRNLKSALEQSSGQVAVILGDDDMLARTDALSIYAASFASNPAVGYACANVIQIDGDGAVALAYVVVDETTVYEKGPQALEHLLLSSVHIAGIAFRRVPDLLEHYPSEEMLFPQVKLASEILTSHGGMAIGAFLTAARASESQLGFTAMKKTRAGR